MIATKIALIFDPTRAVSLGPQESFNQFNGGFNMKIKTGHSSKLWTLRIVRPAVLVELMRDRSASFALLSFLLVTITMSLEFIELNFI